MQSRKHSLIESFSNVAIGYIISLISNILVFPLFDLHPSLMTNLKIGAIFTVISIVRSYYLRRLFNLFLKKVK